MTTNSGLTELSGLEAVELLKQKQIAPTELVTAQKERVDLVEPQINAIVTTCWDRAFECAARLDDLSPEQRGPLCGLPVTIKDLTPVAGVRTTFGSRIFEQNIPAQTSAVVNHIEKRGGVVSGMTNSPEFGAGGNTFNDVFGATLNPWDLKKSAGGSSGGAAASLAAGTSWLSTGSDFAGSLRTPAAFCGVVGLRPSPGRIPMEPPKDVFNDQALQGPMARNVADVAFFFDQMARHAPRSARPVTLPAQSFLEFAQSPKEGAKIAFSADLGLGCVLGPIAHTVNQAIERLEQSGFETRATDLDLSAMDRAYHVFRGLDFAENLAVHLKSHRDLLKPEIVWNIEAGLSLSGAEVAASMAERSRAFLATMKAMDGADVLICPATITPPFDIDIRYWGEQNGAGIEEYLDWLSITYVLTPLGLPVLSIPCGMTGDGLPVGIQIVGRPQDEGTLLSVGAAIESALNPWITPGQSIQL